MPVPKRRMSKRRIGQRNSHAALTPPGAQKCSRCSYVKPRHRVCPQCGHYGDREVVAKED